MAGLVDDVKTEASAREILVVAGFLEILKSWRAAAPVGEWVFASPWNPERPLSYSHVWEKLDRASRAAGLGHVSSPR